MERVITTTQQKVGDPCMLVFMGMQHQSHACIMCTRHKHQAACSTLPPPPTWYVLIQGWWSISMTVGLSPGCFLSADEMKLLASSEIFSGNSGVEWMILSTLSSWVSPAKGGKPTTSS